MNKLVNLSITEISGVTAPANKRKLLVIKSAKEEAKKEAAQDKTKGATMLTKEQITKIGDEDVMKAVVQQQEEMVALEKRVKELEEGGGTAAPSGNDEEVWKGIAPAIRNRFEAIKKERDEFVKRAEAEKEARETDQWITKSKEFKYVQVTPQHFGKVMQKVAAHCPTEADEIVRVLKQADELVSKGAIFQEIGKSTNGRVTMADATNMSARIEAMAEDLMQLDPKLSKQQAVEKALEKNPGWYDAYRRQQLSRSNSASDED